MTKTAEMPTEEDFRQARHLAAELRKKLRSSVYTSKIRSVRPGEDRYIRFEPDPEIVGRVRGTVITIKKEHVEKK